jgi:hypothetical protein
VPMSAALKHLIDNPSDSGDAATYSVAVRSPAIP